MQSKPEQTDSNGRGWIGSTIVNTALCGFLLIAAFYMLAEHRAHLLGWLPYLLLLACPFLHFFMHRGHGGHSGHSGEAREESPARQILRNHQSSHPEHIQ